MQDRIHQDALDETGFWGRQGAGSLVLSRSTGRLLVPHRSDDVLEPNTWGTWGGATDSGESPKTASIRELVEEAGVNQEITLFPLFVFKKGDFQYHNFLAVVDEEFEPVLNWETQEGRWVEVQSVPEPRHPGLVALMAHEPSWTLVESMAKAAKVEVLLFNSVSGSPKASI